MEEEEVHYYYYYYKQTNKQTEQSKESTSVGMQLDESWAWDSAQKTLHCKAKRKASCRATEEGRSATPSPTT
jgi:hypothetical protein